MTRLRIARAWIKVCSIISLDISILGMRSSVTMVADASMSLIRINAMTELVINNASTMPKAIASRVPIFRLFNIFPSVDK